MKNTHRGVLILVKLMASANQLQASSKSHKASQLTFWENPKLIIMICWLGNKSFHGTLGVMKNKTHYQIYHFFQIPESKLAELFQIMKIQTFYGITSEDWILFIPKSSNKILNTLQSLRHEFWNWSNLVKDKSDMIFIRG